MSPPFTLAPLSTLPAFTLTTYQKNTHEKKQHVRGRLLHTSGLPAPVGGWDRRGYAWLETFRNYLPFVPVDSSGLGRWLPHLLDFFLRAVSRLPAGSVRAGVTSPGLSSAHPIFFCPSLPRPRRYELCPAPLPPFFGRDFRSLFRDSLCAVAKGVGRGLAISGNKQATIPIPWHV